MSKTATAIKWHRRGGAEYVAYRAYITGTHYMIERAPRSGWQVSTAKPCECFRLEGYTFTLAEAKAWVEADAQAVKA